MFSGEPLPERVLSANAYLGALPIAARARRRRRHRHHRPLRRQRGHARAADARVRLGARATTTGSPRGSLAGHIIECGCQATGGLLTDWEAVPDWANIGYPIVECRGDGSFAVTKPAGTGGLVARGDGRRAAALRDRRPGAPTCCPTWSATSARSRIEQDGADRVRVAGARGRAPTDTLQGLGDARWRAFAAPARCVIVGIDAAAKARAHRRGDRSSARAGFCARRASPTSAPTHIEVLGAESLVRAACAHARRRARSMLRVVADHAEQARARAVRARDRAGRHVVVAGHHRPRRRPAVGVAARQAVLVPARQGGGAGVVRDRRSARDRRRRRWAAPARRERHAKPLLPATSAAGELEAVESLPLIRFAWARSGDKGDLSNIGVIARRAEWLPLLWERLTPSARQGLARPPGARRGRALPSSRHPGDELRPARRRSTAAARRRAARSARQGHGADAARHADRGAPLDRARGAWRTRCRERAVANANSRHAKALGNSLGPDVSPAFKGCWAARRMGSMETRLAPTLPAIEAC